MADQRCGGACFINNVNAVPKRNTIFRCRIGILSNMCDRWFYIFPCYMDTILAEHQHHYFMYIKTQLKAMVDLCRWHNINRLHVFHKPFSVRRFHVT